MTPKMSSDRPLVSILIPCWGCRDFIAETIYSALAQTYEPIEVIVVEDCGSDGTYEEALKIKDSRLRVYRNENNLGQYGNKNRALQYARGDLIKYLDGDDLLEPHAVSTLIEAWRASGPGTGVVFGQFVNVDRTGEFISKPRRWGIEGRCDGAAILDLVTRKKLAASMFGNVSPHLFIRPVLHQVGGFPNDNAGPGDIETFLKILCVADAYFVGDAVARYRCHSGGMAARNFGVRESTDYIIMVDRLSEFFDRHNDVPGHLREECFRRDWKVWASTHIILASYQRKLRRLPNQFDAIREVFVENGLRKDFDQFVSARLPFFAWASLSTKLRRVLGLHDRPPLFSKREAASLQRKSANRASVAIAAGVELERP